MLAGANHGAEAGLADIGKVLSIDEQTERAETAFEQQAEDPIRGTLIAIRIIVKLLPPGVVDFESHARASLFFPHQIHAGGMPWRQRHSAARAFFEVDLGGVSERVSEYQAEAGAANSGEQL